MDQNLLESLNDIDHDNLAEYNRNIHFQVTPDKQEVEDGAKIDSAKPQYTYKAIIMMTLHQSPNKMLTRSGFVEFILKNFPDKSKKKGWKKNINKTLWQNKCFIQIPIHFDDLGYGNYWVIS